jgi:hypothetical protein
MPPAFPDCALCAPLADVLPRAWIGHCPSALVYWRYAGPRPLCCEPSLSFFLPGSILLSSALMSSGTDVRGLPQYSVCVSVHHLVCEPFSSVRVIAHSGSVYAFHDCEVVMNKLDDYYYRFRSSQAHMPGRCRVRIYQRGKSARTVLLTEVEANTGGSIAGSCESIATDLVVKKSLNPRTTRWIQHAVAPEDPSNSLQPGDDPVQEFDELRFVWDSDKQAGDPQWVPLTDDEVTVLTGEDLAELARPLGDVDEWRGEQGDTWATT